MVGQQLASKQGQSLGPQKFVGGKTYVEGVASEYKIPGWVLWGVYGQETDFGENVSTSSAGARGAYQFIESTARTYNYPYTNELTGGVFGQQTHAAAHYLSDLYKQYGNWDSALRAYSGGAYGEAQVRSKASSQTTTKGLGKTFLGSENTTPGKFAKGIETEVDGIKKFFEFILSAEGWTRIGKVAVGSLALLIAIAELAKVGSGSGGENVAQPLLTKAIKREYT